MANTNRPNLTEEVERLIDASSLLDMLTAIECVCGEKADHLRANWQDGLTARRWEQASKAVGHCVRMPGVSAVS